MMIRVTRLDGRQITINCDLVESVERTPDTVISLITNHKLVVKETVDEVVGRAVEYRRKTHFCPLLRERLPDMVIQGSHPGDPSAEVGR